MGELRHPSYLSLWMSKHGRPDQIRVDFRQTASGAVSWVILAVTTKHDAGSIEVQSAEIGHPCAFAPETPSRAPLARQGSWFQLNSPSAAVILQ